MARKNKTPASQSRNRDNQRRSRARQREYVEDLQQRLRQYERRGVEASLHMQQAAKAVALENRMLRGLLHARGVSQEEIDAYRWRFSQIGCEAEAVLGGDSSRRIPTTIAKRRQSRANTPAPSDGGSTEMIGSPRRTNTRSSPPSTPPSSSAPPIPKPLEAAPSPAVTCIPPTSEPKDSAIIDIEGHDDRDDNHNHNHDSLRASQVLRRDPTKLWNNCPEMSTVSGSDILPPMPDCYCPPDPPVSTPDLTMTAISCEVAVRIIVDRQCYMDLVQARGLLNCEESSDCLVQSSKLFQILDMMA